MDKVAGPACVVKMFFRDNDTIVIKKQLYPVFNSGLVLNKPEAEAHYSKILKHQILPPEYLLFLSFTKDVTSFPRISKTFRVTKEVLGIVYFIAEITFALFS